MNTTRHEYDAPRIWRATNPHARAQGRLADKGRGAATLEDLKAFCGRHGLVKGGAKGVLAERVGDHLAVAPGDCAACGGAS